MKVLITICVYNLRTFNWSESFPPHIVQWVTSKLLHTNFIKCILYSVISKGEKKQILLKKIIWNLNVEAYV